MGYCHNITKSLSNFIVGRVDVAEYRVNAESNMADPTMAESAISVSVRARYGGRSTINTIKRGKHEGPVVQRTTR